VTEGRANWRKSSYTSQENCVEVAFAPTEVFVRDSKQPCGGTLDFSPAAWLAFLAPSAGRDPGDR
jgi:Domain of unknown function (DUF397)